MGLSQEKIEKINFVLSFPKKNELEDIIRRELGVIVSRTEVYDPNLVEIVKARTLRPCPKCLEKGVINNIICDLCDGTGEVTGVGEEKYRPSWISGDKVTGVDEKRFRFREMF